jgi:hypothetical protein
VRAWVSLVVLASCGGGSPPPATPDDDAQVPAPPFVEAPHPAPLAIPSIGGVVLASPKVAVVTFAGYAFADSIEAMADFVPTSSWLATVASEYGVGTPSVVAKVRLSDPAPAFASSSAFATWVTTQSLPQADFYAFVFPAGADFSDPQIGALCNEFTGYHDAHDSAYTFAVVGTCPNHVAGLTDAEQAERVFSHELVEAMTDPFGDGFAARDPELPFTYVDGGELADVCDGQIREGGFVMTRSWSNAAAAAGRDPCQPSSATYFDVSPSSLSVQHVSAGSSVAITLTGFSTAQTNDWVLQDVAGPHGFLAQVAIDATEINNGRTATMTIAVPTSAAPDSTATFFLRSFHAGDPSYSLQPIVVMSQ